MHEWHSHTYFSLLGAEWVCWQVSAGWQRGWQRGHSLFVDPAQNSDRILWQVVTAEWGEGALKE